jgi:enoyl-CoA hydratase/carnithine racemase
METIRVSHPGDGIAEITLDVEDAAWRTAAASPDRREGIAAFAEKRKPVWPER